MNQTAVDPAARPGKAVASMFSAIAPTYDLLNHLLSLNIDKLWRRAAAKALAPMGGEACLDLCTGTGDLAFAVMKACPGCAVTGADFSPEMMRRAGRKAEARGIRLPLVRADAMALPFRDGAFGALTVAFGIRNFEDLEKGLHEMARVLSPSGRAVILEFSPPRRSILGAAYRLYFTGLLPLVGKIVSRDAHAYGYLPSTVKSFLSPEELTDRLLAAGFSRITHKPLTFGIAVLTVARKNHTANSSPNSGMSLLSSP